MLIPPQGHGSGGLALFWRDGLQLTTTTSCKNFINADICYENKNFLAIFLYADPDPSLRRQNWLELTEEFNEKDMAWFLIGDFNDIISHQEKTGGRERAEGSFGNFRSFLSECDIYDLPHCEFSYLGEGFTELK